MKAKRSWKHLTPPLLSSILSTSVALAGAPLCGAPEVILDDGYDGTLDPMACCEVVVADSPASLQDLAVRIAVSHTRVGDLTIKLRSPEGTIATLMSRPGLDEPADDGSAAGGYDSDWNAALVTFDDQGGGTSAELLGQSGAAVCSGDGVCNYSSAPGSATGSGLADFVGEDPNGVWLCCVGDGAPGDSGNLEDCSVAVGSTTTTVVTATTTTTLSLVTCSDTPALVAARAAVEATCHCAGATAHGAYVKCAKGVLKQLKKDGVLPKDCKRGALTCAAKSTCGKSGAVTCCVQTKNGTKCKVKPDGAKCEAKGGCVDVPISCCDACGAGNCVASGQILLGH